MQFLVVPVLVAFLVALLRGGRVANLASLSPRCAWIPLAMLFLQIIFVLFPQGQSDFALDLRPWINVSTYVMLVAFLGANRRLAGMKIILVGGVLNLMVILANGGYMPVTSEALMRSGHLDLIYYHDEQAFVRGSKDIVLTRDQTRLMPLSDVLKVPELIFVPATFSIGDVFITTGAAWLVYSALLGIRGKKDDPHRLSSQKETAGMQRA